MAEEGQELTGRIQKKVEKSGITPKVAADRVVGEEVQKFENKQREQTPLWQKIKNLGRGGGTPTKPPAGEEVM
jgi:hypothetical protein